MVVVIGIAAGSLHTGDGPVDSGFLHDTNSCAQGGILYYPGNLVLNTADSGQLADRFPMFETNSIAFAVRKSNVWDRQ